MTSRRARASAMVLAAVVAASALVATAPPAAACSCATPTDQTALDQADAAFVGTLVDRVDTSPDGEGGFSSADPATFTFDVDRVYKGAVAATQEVISVRSGVSCGLEVIPGVTYLVFGLSGADGDFLPEPGPGQYVGYLCNGTRLNDDTPPMFAATPRPPQPLSAESAADRGIGDDDGLPAAPLIAGLALVVLVGVGGATLARRRPHA